MIDCKHGIPIRFCPECYAPEIPAGNITRRRLISGALALALAPRRAYSFATPNDAEFTLFALEERLTFSRTEWGGTDLRIAGARLVGDARVILTDLTITTLFDG